MCILNTTSNNDWQSCIIRRITDLNFCFHISEIIHISPVTFRIKFPTSLRVLSKQRCYREIDKSLSQPSAIAIRDTANLRKAHNAVSRNDRKGGFPSSEKSGRSYCSASILSSLRQRHRTPPDTRLKTRPLWSTVIGTWGKVKRMQLIYAVGMYDRRVECVYVGNLNRR